MNSVVFYTLVSVFLLAGCSSVPAQTEFVQFHGKIQRENRQDGVPNVRVELIKHQRASVLPWIIRPTIVTLVTTESDASGNFTLKASETIPLEKMSICARGELKAVPASSDEIKEGHSLVTDLGFRCIDAPDPLRENIIVVEETFLPRKPAQ